MHMLGVRFSTEETYEYRGTCLNLMMVAVREELPGEWSEDEEEGIAEPGGGSKWAGKKSTVTEETKHAKALWQEVAKQVWGTKRRPWPEPRTQGGGWWKLKPAQGLE